MATVLLDLMNHEQVGAVVLAFERAIAESFAADLSRQTGDETKRRFAICEGILRHLRGDLGWSLQRVLDHLPRYLRCELDGSDWKPDARTSWAAGEQH